MFVRKKSNKSGLISVQVIDKSTGKYKLVKTIGSGRDKSEVDQLVLKAHQFIKNETGEQELDFTNYRKLYSEILSSISSLKLVGIQYVLGKIFDEIGFNIIPDKLFKDLVLYRLVYPKSKLKTAEYLKRFEQKEYSEDAIYRYMDKLHSTHKERVQQISFEHTKNVLGGRFHAVFYDVTTIYFEVQREDDLRKTGFSKDGKQQHPQIVLGLLVSKDAYPLAYDIFEGNKYEGDTFLPVLESFSKKYQFDKLTVVADAGLLSKKNIDQLENKGYEFILGARIKNESRSMQEKILRLKLAADGASKIIKKGNQKLIVTYSAKRAEKDRYNRDKGLKRLKKQIKSGKLTKSQINKRGYNKFLKMQGEITIVIDEEKAQKEAKWDGLKGYITNSNLSKKEVLENYAHLWKIEKAFKVAKSELKIRPIYHYKKERIEAHICLNFTAYKIYKELERQLRNQNSDLSPEKVIEIIQNIYEIHVITPDKNVIKQTIITTQEQKQVRKLFDF